MPYLGGLEAVSTLFLHLLHIPNWSELLIGTGVGGQGDGGTGRQRRRGGLSCRGSHRMRRAKRGSEISDCPSLKRGEC